MKALESTNQIMPPKLPILSSSSLCWRRQAITNPPSILEAGQVHYVRLARHGMDAAFRMMGLQSGDEVLLPAYHCVSMVEPVLRAGGSPVFYPVQPDTRIEPDVLRRCTGPHTRAAIVPHFFGFHQPIAELRATCDDLGIRLIEDCAHSFFGEIDGRPIGSYGHYSVASPWKFLPVMEGGCLIVNTGGESPTRLRRAGWKAELKSLFNNIERSLDHQRLIMTAPLFRPLIWLTGKRRINIGNITNDDKHPRVANTGPVIETPELTRVSRFIIEHSDLDRAIRLRRKYYQQLQEIITDMPGAKPLHDLLPEDVIPQVFPLVIENPAAAFPKLREQGIPIIRFGEYLWEGMDPDLCPVSAHLSRSVFQLPCHQELSDREVDWIGLTIRQTIE